MKKSLALAALLGLAITSTATANNFSVSGAGGSIPDAPVAGAGVWNGTYTGVPFSSVVTVPRAVTSITSVTLTSLNHSWRGDLHIILRDPSGAGHSIVTRPGFTGAGFGDSGNYGIGTAPGTFVFVASGGGAVNAGASDIPGGTYNQFFNAGAGSWTAAGISNTPLGSITGAAGTWTLEIRDWANADLGSLAGWTLSGTDVNGGTVTTFCECPAPGVCSNPGALGNGCNNSVGAGGANLSVAGNILTVTGTKPGATVVFVKGTLAATTTFNDGLLCMDNLIRFGLTTADGAGTSTAVDMGSGNYQAFYRDVPGSPCGNNANATNGISY